MIEDYKSLLVGGFALAAFFALAYYHTSATNQVAPQQLPNNTLILPAFTNSNGTLPATQTTTANPCSCSQNTNGLSSTVQSLLNQWGSAITSIEQSYSQSIQSALPAYEQQFFNNLTGWNESLSSQAALL